MEATSLIFAWFSYPCTSQATTFKISLHVILLYLLKFQSIHGWCHYKRKVLKIIKTTNLANVQEGSSKEINFSGRQTHFCSGIFC